MLFLPKKPGTTPGLFSKREPIHLFNSTSREDKVRLFRRALSFSSTFDNNDRSPDGIVRASIGSNKKSVNISLPLVNYTDNFVEDSGPNGKARRILTGLFP
jgi:hypothetical protein